MMTVVQRESILNVQRADKRISTVNLIILIQLDTKLYINLELSSKKVFFWLRDDMLPCSEYPEMGPKVEVRRNPRPCVGNARDQVASGWIRKGLTSVLRNLLCVYTKSIYYPCFLWNVIPDIFFDHRLWNFFISCFIQKEISSPYCWTGGSLLLSSRGDDAEELGPHKTPLTRRFLTVVLRRRNSMFQQVDPLKIEVNELQFLKKNLDP